MGAKGRQAIKPNGANDMADIQWCVSYYVDAERYWQFAGEGSRQWAQERAAYLKRNGHKQVRIRFRLTGEPIVAVE
jgi:hypothetical protein